MQNLSYCAAQVHAHDHDRFLAALFVRQPHREALLALYALNLELAQIRSKISEPVIGQLRLAWWQEALAELYAGKPPRGHPVVQALAPVAAHLPQALLLALPERYREHFPESPPDDVMETLSLVLLRSLCPEAEGGWRKARDMISKHRQRYGRRRNGWLNIKLLLAGF